VDWAGSKGDAGKEEEDRLNRRDGVRSCSGSLLEKKHKVFQRGRGSCQWVAVAMSGCRPTVAPVIMKGCGGVGGGGAGGGGWKPPPPPPPPPPPRKGVRGPLGREKDL
jgi:hypothetical protein